MPDDAVTGPSRISPDDVAKRQFSTVRRGFDPQEVRSYLDTLARELSSGQHRDQELRAQLSEAQERALHPQIDEALLTSSLGQRSAAVLRSAHEEAARITEQADTAANGLLREAQHQATEIQVTAESSSAERIAEAELSANAVRQQARDEASGLLETARLEAEAIVDRARDQGRSMLEQAQEARRRVLADMATRRRGVSDQIEQFRAARDQIAGSVLGVRTAVDRILDELELADDAARSVAAATSHAPRADDERTLLEEAERAAAELGLASGAVPFERTPARSGDPSHADRATDEAPRLRASDVAMPVADAPAAADAGLATAPEPEPEPEAEAEPEPPDTPPTADTQPASDVAQVDVLFAKLRAGQPEDGGQTTVIPDTSGAREVDDDVDDEDDDVDDEVEESELAESRPAEVVAALAQRAELLEPIVTSLARRLKRALQDDQNRLLDRLRKGTGEWHDDLLVDEEAQRDLYRAAATEQLRDAMGAGISFARALRPARGQVPSPEQATVDALTDDLAANVVALLRRRLEGDGVPDAAERIGAAYREWRGERIERLAEDRALDAFGAGVLRGAPKGSVLVWATGDGGPGCADCDDNALAGEVVAGEEFPTGHRHPPAHAGCRCLVMPTPA